MKREGFTCPMPREQVVGQYFMEHRAKLLDVAAFLDRVDRSKPDTDTQDFRLAAMQDLVAILADGQGDRVQRMLMALSDPSEDPIPEAHTQGATGAYPGER